MLLYIIYVILMLLLVILCFGIVLQESRQITKINIRQNINDTDEEEDNNYIM